MKSLLLAFALCCVSVPAFAGEVSSDTPAPQMTRDQKKLVPVVVDYVRNNRGWMDGVYSVEYTGQDGDLLIFTVVLVGNDADHLVIADGQSFQVEVDPVTKTVKSERFF